MCLYIRDGYHESITLIRLPVHFDQGVPEWIPTVYFN